MICCDGESMKTNASLDLYMEHSCKQTLNEAIRCGIRPVEKRKLTGEPLFTKPLPEELPSLSFNRLADEWDDEETLREISR